MIYTLDISLANSIRFYEDDGLMKNFDNRLSCDTFDRIIGIKYSQLYYKTDEIPLQIKGNGVIVVTYHFDEGGSIQIFPFVTDVVGTDNYLSYKINQSKSGYISVTNSFQTFYSEHIKIVDSAPILVQWFNFDDAFGWHKRDDMVNFMRFNGYLTGYQPKGSVKVYDNQEEEVKVKEVIYRTMKLTLDAVPQSVAEKLTIAQAHDLFVVNDVEYVCDALPSIKPLGHINMYEVEMTLTEKEAIGINRHDNGYDPDDPSYYVDRSSDNYTDSSGNLYTD